ncbi:MAG: flagellar biosynthesis protein FlhA [Planctomycetota bacterium]
MSSTSSMPGWMQPVAKYRSLFVPLGFVSLLVVILIPVHPVVMDALIAGNIALSIIMLMTTMYTEEPLEFGVFPSLLLATTLARLVLNVASTRLILTADATSPEAAADMAGKVIQAFGGFVAGGSLAVGLIIFIILVVVQFVVITKGATRISEVAARFTLDAMPGKQMAIDADLNAGVIDEKEARTQRERIRQEADFFGAMDGASKFVRGDAIAGIIITLVNIVGGLAIGALEKGWSIGDTAQVFTVLTIGDGLASQIPSFVISIAAALVVTRASSKGSLGMEMSGQLGSKTPALLITAGFCTLLAFTPLPALPLLGLAAFLAVIAWSQERTKKTEQVQRIQAAADEEKATAEAAPPVEDLLKVDTLELEVGIALVALVDQRQGGQLLDRISAVRRQLAAELGFVMPPVRIRDNMTLDRHAYRVKIRGSVVAEGETRPDMLMAMDSGIATQPLQGEATREPAFGLDAWWIPREMQQRAESANYTVVDPTSVLTTHLSEVVKTHADELLTREEVNNLVTQLKERAPKLAEEAVPGAVGTGELQKILQNLLRERVPIRDLESVLETLSDWAPKTKDLDVLTEYVRNALRRSICQTYAQPTENAQGVRGWKLVCVTLDPAFEDVINAYIDRSPAGTTLAMPANVANLVTRQVGDTLRPILETGGQPVVITSPQVRAQVRQILEPSMPTIAVLSYNEIVSGVEVESMGLISAPEEIGQPVGV